MTTIDLLDPQPSDLPLDQAAVLLDPRDDVAIARINLAQGLTLRIARDGQPAILPVRQLIPSGHKLALRDVAEGAPVRRYGQVIGVATRPIAAGEHVHTHNLAARAFERAADAASDVQPAAVAPEGARRTFLGYPRADGRVGTRNYLAVIASVNCSGHTVREIAHYFTPERLVAYPRVDGVIALTHGLGCAMRVGGADYLMLQRVLTGMARHPNVGASLLVGLGCETEVVGRAPSPPRAESPRYRTLTIQDEGGIRKTARAGIAAVEELLPQVDAAARTPQPVSELTVALQCGGSDGWSGVTANPALGLVSDAIVRQGGRVVLAETPEIYGAEHLLTRRAISAQVAGKLLDKVRWWERHTARLDMEIDNNPGPGNKAGGLTTIYEKSLGAVAKAGSTPLMDVYDYAEPVTARGFTFMDTPGYDPMSATGQVAGGCNLILFTTGRGSVFGFKPAPSIKVASHTALYQRMLDDMDLDAGRALDGAPLQQVADELLELAITVASGQPSKSEAQGVGEAEFDPWFLGGVV
jgi:altronate hydrolase